MTETKIDAAALFRAHAAFVARFLRRLGVTSTDVDDLVQEVFVIAHRKGGYVVGDAQPRTWLAAIAFNVTRTERRSASRRSAVLDNDTVERAQATQPGPSQTLETQRALDRVEAALATLDPDHRATFILFEIEGIPSEGIASALNVPVGTVYSRLHNARKRFMQAHAALLSDTQSPPLAPHARSRR